MELNSYKHFFEDGGLKLSGTYMKLYEPVSQITWAQEGVPFLGLKGFFVLSANRRLIQICMYTFL
jgi:hypothetical protein